MKAVEKLAVLSDTHFGDAESLFTHYDADGAIARLANLLRANGPYDEIVLLGDMVDFALSPLARCYDMLRDFLAKLLAGPGLPTKRLIYVPGNHDHHLWSEQAETAFVEPALRCDGAPAALPSQGQWPRMLVDVRFPWDDGVNQVRAPDFRVAPPVDGRLLIAGLLPDQVKAMGAAFEFVMKFPIHLVQVGEPFVLTHGHFFEEIHKPVSAIIEQLRGPAGTAVDWSAIKPTTLENLEAFNYFWQEAIWYYLGQSGDLVDVASQIYNGASAGDERTLRDVVGVALQYLARKYPKKLAILEWPGVKKLLTDVAVEILTARVDAATSHNRPIDQKMLDEIADVLQHYVLSRYLNPAIYTDGRFPTPFTMIFGHTHFKEATGQPLCLPTPTPLPAAQATPENGVKFGSPDQRYTLYNTGGFLRSCKANGRKDAGFFVVDAAKPAAERVRWVDFI